MMTIYEITVGMRLEAKWGDKFYPARVVSIQRGKNAPRSVQVRFAGYGDVHNAYLPLSALREIIEKPSESHLLTEKPATPLSAKEDVVQLHCSDLVPMLETKASSGGGCVASSQETPTDPIVDPRPVLHPVAGTPAMQLVAEEPDLQKPLSAKEEIIVQKIRAAVRVVCQAEPEVTKHPLRYGELADLLERHAKMSKKTLVHIVTQVLNLTSPADVFRLHCSDLVRMIEIKASSGGGCLASSQETPTDPIVDPRPVLHPIVGTPAMQPVAEEPDLQPTHVLAKPLSAKEESLVELIRAAVRVVCVAEPEITRGPIRFTELVQLLERHASISKPSLVDMATQGLKLKNATDVFRLHCSDLVRMIGRKRGSSGGGCLASSQETPTDPIVHLRPVLHPIVEPPAMQPVAEEPDLQQTDVLAKPLSAKEEGIVQKIRAAVRVVCQAEPEVTSGPIRFAKLAQLLERHASISKPSLVDMATQGLKLKNATDLFRLHCSDLVCMIETKALSGGGCLASSQETLTDSALVPKPCPRAKEESPILQLADSPTQTCPGPLPTIAKGSQNVHLAQSLDTPASWLDSPGVAVVMEELRKSLARGLPATCTDVIHLHVIGSALNGFGFGNAASSIDVVMVGTTAGGGAANRSNQYIVKMLQLAKDCFEERGCVFSVQDVMLGARIPILKLLHRPSRRELDLSINNLTPLANTYLLRTYSSLDARIRDMGAEVKQWAKDQCMCHATRGWLSSYCLVLMMIYFLQVSKGLPSLQELCPEHDWAQGNIPPSYFLLHPPSGSSDDWVHEFFVFYAGIFIWGDEVVSIRLGRRVFRSDLAVSKLKRAQIDLDIEDPFLLDMNLGNHLQSAEKLTHFREAIVKATERICGGDPGVAFF